MDILETLHSNLIFYPSKELNSSPASEGIQYEEVYIDTSDGEKLYGYFLPSVGVGLKPSRTVMLYLHGNAENVSAWYMACTEIQKHVPVNSLIVDYRGYGKSTGTPSLDGVILDAKAMYKYLIDRGYKPGDISVYGRSIGGAIALELAACEKIKSVVVQSSFTSLKDIAKELYAFLPHELIKNNIWNSKELITKIKAPVLISHGDKDEIISINHSYKLYELANEPKKLIVLKGATHNDISSFLSEEYFKTLKEYFL